MKNDNEFPETLTGAIKYFADADRALQFMVSIRWPDGNATCPCCNSTKATFLATRKVWKCRDCGKQFSVKAGTIFEDSALGFDKWLPAFWMIVNAKNGISSCELARALGVTQKTAWFMLHRIRLEQRDVCTSQPGEHLGVAPVALALVAGDGVELARVGDENRGTESCEITADPRAVRASFQSHGGAGKIRKQLGEGGPGVGQ